MPVREHALQCVGEVERSSLFMAGRVDMRARARALWLGRPRTCACAAVRSSECSRTRARGKFEAASLTLEEAASVLEAVRGPSHASVAAVRQVPISHARFHGIGMVQALSRFAAFVFEFGVTHGYLGQ
eukprot:6194114-Pleurochrysis_carterae.AAC.2